MAAGGAPPEAPSAAVAATNANANDASAADGVAVSAGVAAAAAHTVPRKGTPAGVTADADDAMADDRGAPTDAAMPVVAAARTGAWLLPNEQNLPPGDVLEALNRLLDDNWQLRVPGTGEVVTAAPGFDVIATQSPSGAYTGRMTLSRALRGRIVEFLVGRLSDGELLRAVLESVALPPRKSPPPPPSHPYPHRKKTAATTVAPRSTAPASVPPPPPTGVTPAPAACCIPALYTTRAAASVPPRPKREKHYQREKPPTPPSHNVPHEDDAPTTVPLPFTKNPQQPSKSLFSAQATKIDFFHWLGTNVRLGCMYCT